MRRRSFIVADALFTQKVQQKYWWSIVKKTKFGTKKVESFCYSRNIFHWNFFYFKSRISTNGDYWWSLTWLRKLFMDMMALWLSDIELQPLWSCELKIDVMQLQNFSVMARRLRSPVTPRSPFWIRTRQVLNRFQYICSKLRRINWPRLVTLQ